MTSARWVTFLSDYGWDDVFVGVCKGVIARIAPDVRVIDICHQLAPQAVEQAATSLVAALPYLPDGAVHLALVDPMADSPARGVVVSTAAGALLVGPDNGVLSLAWDHLGGVTAAYEISNRDLWLPTPSRTFRGRDVFAPVTAHLAAGTAPTDVGAEIEAGTLRRVRVREPYLHDDHVHGEIRNVDHFGNLALNVARADLEALGVTLGDTIELRCSGRSMAIPFTMTYGDVPPGRVALCEDSFRAVMVAVNLGSAARSLKAGRGDPVVLGRAPQSTV